MKETVTTALAAARALRVQWGEALSKYAAAVDTSDARQYRLESAALCEEYHRACTTLGVLLTTTEIE